MAIQLSAGRSHRIEVSSHTRSHLIQGLIAKRINVMYTIESDPIKTNDQTEQDILLYKVSDDALERTAQMWGTAVYTLGNCTGLGSCPA